MQLKATKLHYESIWKSSLQMTADTDISELAYNYQSMERKTSYIGEMSLASTIDKMFKKKCLKINDK